MHCVAFLFKEVTEIMCFISVIHKKSPSRNEGLTQIKLTQIN